MSDLDFCLDVLQVLDIEEVIYRLDGHGDSGVAYLETIIYRDGREASALPKITIGITNGGRTVVLADRVEDLVYDIPNFDWINNEGGSGTVSLRPLEPEERVLCDMTYREEDTDEPDFVDEEDIDTEINDRESEPGAITIEDGVLHPEEGAEP
jgi:hypothetical protein